MKVNRAVSFFGFMTVANKDPDLRVIGMEQSCYLTKKVVFPIPAVSSFCLYQSITSVY